MEDPPADEDCPQSDEDCIKAIREALSRLVTDGLVPFNVTESGGFLLKLDLVRSLRAELDGDAGEIEIFQADAAALRPVLEDAVKHKSISGKHRRLLRDVLPLKDEHLGKSVKERRTEAGKDLKPGKKEDIGPDTIRTYYEPKALDKLTEVLWEMESEFRAKVTSSKKKSASED
jgi:hypothetical protein